MISVRLTGHIRTSVGSEEVEFHEDEIEAGDLVERLRERCEAKDPGFNMYNTVAMVEDGEAFVAASAGRKLRSGDRVVLIPFSHGG